MRINTYTCVWLIVITCKTLFNHDITTSLVREMHHENALNIC